MLDKFYLHLRSYNLQKKNMDLYYKVILERLNEL